VKITSPPLFGWAALGEPDPESALDLIVINCRFERLLDRPLAVTLLPSPAEVFVYTPEEFQRMKEQESPFLLSILRDAIVVYPIR